ncbi:hypothetical protein [Salmonella enterica]|uniref:hypothetical protein n=1 Tax=Salmonella enterica TaxID=28901 RepID=UPI0022379AE4|nr:hypothetical protein [Salmonella enterica]MCW6831721.1 hypothetical protein [Salmonella enterica]
MTEFKTCSRCKELLPIEVFPETKKSLTGFKTNYENRCRPCKAAVAREWRKKNPGYNGTGVLKAIPKEHRKWYSAVSHRLKDARSRCKKFGKPVPDCTVEYLFEILKSQEFKCALTGATLVIESGHPLCLSLDQIEPNKGYSIGNVQWLAWCVNRAKGDLSTNDFIDMCDAVLNNQKVQRLSKSSIS